MRVGARERNERERGNMEGRNTITLAGTRTESSESNALFKGFEYGSTSQKVTVALAVSSAIVGPVSGQGT